VIEEPRGGAHYDPQATISAIAERLELGLDELNGLDVETLKEQRFQKYRQIGAVANG
jgi:acetyl-CoA carboxylase carboxyl transferase subunit alpha